MDLWPFIFLYYDTKAGRVRGSLCFEAKLGETDDIFFSLRSIHGLRYSSLLTVCCIWRNYSVVLSNLLVTRNCGLTSWAPFLPRPAVFWGRWPPCGCLADPADPHALTEHSIRWLRFSVHTMIQLSTNQKGNTAGSYLYSSWNLNWSSGFSPK
jgi:hypothetical protein